MSKAKNTIYAAIGAGTTVLEKAREIPQRVISLSKADRPSFDVRELPAKVQELPAKLGELPGKISALGSSIPERATKLVEESKSFLDLTTGRATGLLSELTERGEAVYRKVQQAFAVLLPVQSVGVMGDFRTYDDVVAVRAVETEDFMTADWSPLPYEVLQSISTRITNTVRGVNRVVYDISSKPPSTIEWE